MQFLSLGPPWRAPKLQENPLVLEREHPALQNMKFLHSFLLLWVPFFLMDLDSDSTKTMRIRIHNTAFTERISYFLLLLPSHLLTFSCTFLPSYLLSRVPSYHIFLPSNVPSYLFSSYFLLHILPGILEGRSHGTWAGPQGWESSWPGLLPRCPLPPPPPSLMYLLAFLPSYVLSYLPSYLLTFSPSHLLTLSPCHLVTLLHSLSFLSSYLLTLHF